MFHITVSNTRCQCQTTASISTTLTCSYSEDAVTVQSGVHCRLGGILTLRKRLSYTTYTLKSRSEKWPYDVCYDGSCIGSGGGNGGLRKASSPSVLLYATQNGQLRKQAQCWVGNRQTDARVWVIEARRLSRCGEIREHSNTTSTHDHSDHSRIYPRLSIQRKTCSPHQALAGQ